MRLWILVLLMLVARLTWTRTSIYTFFTAPDCPRNCFAPGVPDAQQTFSVMGPWLGPWFLACGLPLLFLGLALWRAPRSEWRPCFSPRLTAGALGLTGLALTLLKWGFFPTSQWSTDEFSYYFQSQVVLGLSLRAQATPLPESFLSDGVYWADFVTSGWQSGWPAVIALFRLVHLEDFTNCFVWILLGMSCWRLGRLLWGPAEALAVVWVYICLAPLWALTWGGFPHLWITLLAVLSWVGFLQFLQGSRSSWLWVAVCWALIAVSRVQDLPSAVVVPLIWSLLLRHQHRLSGLLWRGSAACLAALALLALANTLQTGSPWVLPTMISPCHEYLGFTGEHTPWRALYDLTFNACRLLWWAPGLLIPLLLWGSPDGWSWKEKGLLAGVLAQVLLYSLTMMANVDWGVRYYTQTVVSLALMAGPAVLRVGWSRLTWAAGLLLLGFCNLHILRLCTDDASRLYVSPQRTPGLYFCRSAGTRMSIRNFMRNSPGLTPPVYAIWLEPERNRQVRRMFPGLPLYVLDGKKCQRLAESALDQPVDVFAAINRLNVLGDARGAQQYLLQIVARKESAMAYQALAEAEERLKRPREAAAVYAKALALSPDWVALQRQHEDFLRRNRQVLTGD